MHNTKQKALDYNALQDTILKYTSLPVLKTIELLFLLGESSSVHPVRKQNFLGDGIARPQPPDKLA